jgi:putative peptide zinc metalloprotease protein
VTGRPRERIPAAFPCAAIEEVRSRVVNPAPPRLRSDLTVSRQQTAEGSVSVLKDPVSGAFFRFRDAEQFIAEQLDGATPLEEVRRRTEERFAASLTPESLEAFVARLDKAGLLDRGEGTGKHRTDRRGRLRGSLLYLRMPLFDPDELLGRLWHGVRFFFTSQFLALSGAAILLATYVTIAHWGELTQNFSRLYHLSAIPLFLAVAFVVGTAHEFAHGLTCKHFGGQVREMGFMLIYFQPALYTNVSDAWLFPEKAKRLWVGFAGPYFELFVWALATLTWRLTDVEIGLNYLALTVMTLSGIKTLFNFNPFIKLDGYYLLSDYLDMPNLRKRSFAYVGRVCKRLVGWGPDAGAGAEISRRERRAYLAYGLVAAVCSLTLLAYVAVKTGGILIEAHQPAALALLVGVVSVRSRRKFRKLFGTSPDPAAPVDDEDGSSAPTAPSAPTEANQKKEKKRARATRRRLVWAAVAAAALAFVLLGNMELRIGGAFAVLPEENADVRAQVDGIVEDIAVTEGDEVQAGDVIAQLSNHALVAELGKTEGTIRETRAFLKKLEAGPTPEEIAVVKAAVARVEDRLEYARNQAARLRGLFETGAATRQELEAAQELATTAENELTEARGRLDMLLRRSRPEDIEASRARLASLETQQRFLEGEVRELTVVSPVTGIVATPARQLKEMERQLVGRGVLIARVYDFTTVMAQIVVPEKEIADVRAGQPVVLRVRAYPNVAFHGTVTAIATAAEGTPTAAAQAPIGGGVGGAAGGGGTVPGRTFIVTTRIDNRGLLLKPGMTGYAKVMGGQRRIAGLITRRLARSLKVEVWSWW